MQVQVQVQVLVLVLAAWLCSRRLRGTSTLWVDGSAGGWLHSLPPSACRGEAGLGRWPADSGILAGGRGTREAASRGVFDIAEVAAGTQR